MRRKFGIGAIEAQKAEKKRYESKQIQLTNEDTQNMGEVMNKFKHSLVEFSKLYNTKLRTNHQFRENFLDMCSQVGLDPLESNTTVWGLLSGFHEFYFKIAIKIIEIMTAQMNSTGGFVPIDYLVEYISSSGLCNVTAADILKAVDKTQKLGPFIKVIKLNKDTTFLSMNTISDDHVTVLKIAEKSCSISRDVIQKTLTNWSIDRIQFVLDQMIEEGTLWIDLQHPSKQIHYYYYRSDCVYT